VPRTPLSWCDLESGLAESPQAASTNASRRKVTPIGLIGGFAPPVQLTAIPVGRLRSLDSVCWLDFTVASAGRSERIVSVATKVSFGCVSTRLSTEWAVLQSRSAGAFRIHKALLHCRPLVGSAPARKMRDAAGSWSLWLRVPRPQSHR